MPDPQLVEILGRLSAGAMLALAVVAFMREWVITRGRYLEMKQDRDLWRRIAVRNQNLLGMAADALIAPSAERSEP